MVTSVTQMGVNALHIRMREIRSTKAIDAITVVLVDLLVTTNTVEMLALVGFSGKPFEQLGNHIFLGVAVGEDEVGIDTAMGISDELQIGVDYGVGKCCSKPFDNINPYHANPSGNGIH